MIDGMNREIKLTMKKAEAFDVLSERIRDMCISDLIYSDSTEKGSVEMMIAVLSDINATNELLVELVKKDGECGDDSNVC